MLDTHQLNVFLIAAEMLNFTQAARLLHMSQPSVSQHIQSLEKSFGQPLFIRSGRQLELTAAGHALVPLARDIVERSHMIEETMKSLEGEVYGHLYVGCSTTPGKYILPQLLTDFHREYPLVRVSCHVTSQGKAMELLCDGEVHIAMVSEPHMSCRTAETRRFMVDPVMLIAPLDHPWAQHEEIEPHELYTGEFILREEGSGTQMAVKDGLSNIGIPIEDLETLLVLGSSEAIALSVKEGLGVGFVSQIVVTQLVADQVATIRVRDLDIVREIHIGIQQRKPQTAAQKAFWSFIGRELSHSEPDNESVEEFLLTA
jgi:DNA-binding transcriptional LysR family regulator